MIKPVSTLSIIVAGVMCIVPTFGAQMTPQIQRLLDQKQEKIKKLEECEGKKQGWMIAGISTIGVTAVGVGLNIAQASKRNRLDDEIDTARHDLEVQERHLGEINSQIADRERENAERECSQQEGTEWKNGQKASDDGIATGPKLDAEPDGKIGDPCGTDNKGKWTEKTDGPNTCSNANVSVQCECAVETSEIPGGGEKSDKPGDDEKPKQESSLQKCLRERADSEEGKACCYLSKSVAKWDGKSCICEDDKEFSIGSNGRGKCKDKEGDDKPVECEDGHVRILHGDGKCVKVDYLQSDKCACKDGTDDCLLIDDNNGQFICQSSIGWGFRCSCQECPVGESFNTSSNKCEAPCDGVKLKGVCLPKTYANAVYNFKNNCTRQISAHYTCSTKSDIGGICGYLGGVTKSISDRFYCDCGDTNDSCNRVFRVH